MPSILTKLRRSKRDNARIESSCGSNNNHSEKSPSAKATHYKGHRHPKVQATTGTKAPAPTDTTAAPAESVSSPLNSLSADVLVAVVSFVAYAPYEIYRLDRDGRFDKDHERLYQDYVNLSHKSNGTDKGKENKISRSKSLSQGSSAALFFSRSPKSNTQDEVGNHGHVDVPINAFSTLTHVLPLVCKQFRTMCREDDVLWSEAMTRLALNDTKGWRLALEEYDGFDGGREGFRSKKGMAKCTDAKSSPSDIDTLISKACASFHESLYGSSIGVPASKDYPTSISSRQQDVSIAKLLFKCLSKEAEPTTFTAPLFQMRTAHPLQIGRKMHLHLFEPRYRLLIEKAMKGRSSYEKSGGIINDHGGKKPRPRFLFSFGVRPPLVASDPAAIVELRRCHIFEDGRANVTIVPVAHAQLIKVWQNRGTHGLIEASCQSAPMVRLRAKNKRSVEEVKAPGFFMPAGTAPELGIEFSLLLYEPRYVDMVAALTYGLANRYVNGDAIPGNRPQFIHAYEMEGVVGEQAVVLELRRCKMMSNMTAQVTVVPTAQGRISKVETYELSSQTSDVTIRVQNTLDGI